jgi:hypothetical protein
MVVYVHGAQTAAERHRILAAFRRGGAVTSETAKTLAQLGLREELLIRRYRDRGIIRETDRGAYYLDEDALREFEHALLKWLAVPAAVIIALIVWAIARGAR